MMSFVLVEDLWKRAFNQSSNKTKPFITIKANHGLSSVRKDSWWLVRFVFRKSQNYDTGTKKLQPFEHSAGCRYSMEGATSRTNGQVVRSIRKSRIRHPSGFLHPRNLQTKIQSRMYRRHNKSMGATERKRYEKIRRNRMQAHRVRRKRKARRRPAPCLGLCYGLRGVRCPYIERDNPEGLPPLQGN